MLRIAIIEDDPRVMAGLLQVIAACDDMAVTAKACTFAEGKAIIDHCGYDVLVCDLGLPDGDGTELIHYSCRHCADADVLVVTMFAEHHRVIAAIKAGARGYVLKDQNLAGCITAIRDVRAGGSPISPIIARLLLKEWQEPAVVQDPAVETLTARELETLHLLARGFTDGECAEMLCISSHTVGSHVKNIYRKLEVRSRAEAVFEATSLGILDRR